LFSGYSIAIEIDSTDVRSPNGPHTEYQQQFVRRFCAEARSLPLESRPTKYCNGTDARSHAFCPKPMIDTERGPWLVFTHRESRWGELIRISITRCEYADKLVEDCWLSSVIAIGNSEKTPSKTNRITASVADLGTDACGEAANALQLAMAGTAPAIIFTASRRLSFTVPSLQLAARQYRRYGSA
jgi:hypothetical protein